MQNIPVFTAKDVVLVEDTVDKQPETLDSGIILTKSGNDYVQRVGKLVVFSGNELPGFEAGDEVIYKQSTGWDFKYDNKNYRFLRVDDILGKFVNKEGK